jgi:hypothetical protein
MDMRKTWLLLFLVIIALAAVVYPVYVIRPFRAQGARELAAALFVSRWAPWITVLSAAVGVLLVSRLWRHGRILHKLGLVVATLLLVTASTAAHVNIYERMFNPVTSARFIPAAEAKYAPTDMVMSVHVNGATRAYPVRAMGYHHVINDVVAREPLVATY